MILTDDLKKSCIQQHRLYCNNWRQNKKIFEAAFNDYDNLLPTDFKAVFEDLHKASEYPAFLGEFDRDAKMWIEVEKMSETPRNNVADIEKVERKVLEYESAFPQGNYITNAKELKNQLEGEKKEMVDWKSFLNSIEVSEDILNQWNENQLKK